LSRQIEVVIEDRTHPTSHGFNGTEGIDVVKAAHEFAGRLQTKET